MPNLPEVPTGWPAHTTVSYTTRARLEKDPFSPGWLRMLRYFFRIVTTSLCLVSLGGVLLYGTHALHTGTVEVLVLLLVCHLPWVALWHHKRVQNLRRGWLSAAKEAKSEHIILPTRDDSPIIGFPVRIQESGLQYYRFSEDKIWKATTFQGWEEISRFEYKGEIGKYFRIRLWGRPLRHRQRPSDRSNWYGIQALVYSPLILTVLVAFLSMTYFGARPDTLTAVLLSIFYGCLVLLMRRTISPHPKSDLESSDFLIDNTVVTATELLTFLEKRIPQMETDEQK